MRRLALHLTRDPHRAADLEQDTWVRLIRNPPASRVSIKAWIATVMKNSHRNGYRGEQRRLKREHGWCEPGSVAEGEAGASDPDVIEAVLGSVGRLGEKYHEVISLHFFYQLTPQEISEQLGIPAATVRTRLRRSLQQLRDDLDRRHGGRRSLWVGSLAAWMQQPPSVVPLGSVARRFVRSGGVKASVMGGLLLLPVLSVLMVTWVPVDVAPGKHPTSPVVAPTVEQGDVLRPVSAGASEPLLVDLVPVAAPTMDVAHAAMDVPPVRPSSNLVRVVDGRTGELLPKAYVLPTAGGVRRPPSVAEMETSASLKGNPIDVPPEALEPFRVSPNADLVDVLIWAPGFAWELERWTIGEPGEREVRMWPSSRLVLRLAAPSPPYLRIVPPAGYVNRWLAKEEGPGPWEITVDGLPAGRNIVQWLCDHQPPVVLEQWEVELAPGSQLALDLEEPAHEDDPARFDLAGTLVAPPQDEDLLEVICRPLGRPEGHSGAFVVEPPEHLALLTKGKLSPDGRRQYSWSFEGLRPGDYTLLVRPFGLARRVSVGASDVEPTHFDVSSLAQVQISVVDELTGFPIDVGALSWHPVREGNLGRGLGNVTIIPDADGQYRIECMPGRIAVIANQGALKRGVFGELKADVRAGFQLLTLSISPICRLAIQVMEDGVLMPIDKRRGHRVGIERVDGRDVPIWNRLMSHSSFGLLEPGAYMLRFAEMEGFEPVPDLPVEVIMGEHQELVFDLVRVR